MLPIVWTRTARSVNALGDPAEHRPVSRTLGVPSGVLAPPFTPPSEQGKKPPHTPPKYLHDQSFHTTPQPRTQGAAAPHPCARGPVHPSPLAAHENAPHPASKILGQDADSLGPWPVLRHGPGRTARGPVLALMARGLGCGRAPQEPGSRSAVTPARPRCPVGSTGRSGGGEREGRGRQPNAVKLGVVAG
jgi:hypothetical protein